MAAVQGARWYNAVWRWHFYAGMLCMPFVLWLAATGTIYLWKPQIEAWLERPYDNLQPIGARASADLQVRAAGGALMGATLHKYQLPEAPGAATRVIMGRNGEDFRVFVDPYRLRVLAIEREAERPMRFIADLHGTLRAEVVTARAVAPLDRLVQWAMPLLGVGGTLLALKGRGALAEVQAAASRVRSLGGAAAEVVPAATVAGVDDTTIVRIVRETVRNPRRDGR